MYCIFISQVRDILGLWNMKLFHASAAVWMSYSLFLDIMQRRVSYITDVSGQPIGPIFRGQEDQEELL